MKKFKTLLLGIILFLFIGTTLTYAGTGYEKLEYYNDHIYTTDKLDKTITDRGNNYIVNTGITGVTLNVGTGQHIYQYTRHGVVPIGYWRLEHYPAQCIHTHPKEKFLGPDDAYYWEGIAFRSRICSKFYNRGWQPYCADCGKRMHDALIYASDDTIDNTTHLNVDDYYYYACPHCNHLENQDYGGGHQCDAVSYNRYFVSYHANGGIYSMSNSTHYYNNSTTYEGLTVVPQKKLTLNSFEKEGYVFNGWNTKADGTGTKYTNGQEIFNLTSEQNGIINLYAQWTPANSTLYINPNGGKYKNSTATASVSQGFSTTYTINSSDFTNTGYTVTFNMNGHGDQVASITTTKSLSPEGLTKSNPFVGTLDPQISTNGQITSYIYTFKGLQGASATVTAQWANNSFTLPNATATNLAFGGWFTDAACTNFYGKNGDVKVTDRNITLYAKWAPLKLSATNDYTSNSKRGAVDLYFRQADNSAKFYKAYQSTNKTTWTLVQPTKTVNNTITPISYSYDSGSGTIPIKQAGYYKITATGGKGSNYGSYTGGLGGKVEAYYLLRPNDFISYSCGTAGSGTTAGTNPSLEGHGGAGSGLGAAGGAATLVSVQRNGYYTRLLTAGGGGGANNWTNGGAGGTGGGSNVDRGHGTAGPGGGGGGQTGGAPGIAIQRDPIEQLQKYTGEFNIACEYKSSQAHKYQFGSSVTETINGTTYYVYTTKSGKKLYSTSGGFAFTPDGKSITAVSRTELKFKAVKKCGCDECNANQTVENYHHTFGSICNGALTFYEKVSVPQDPIYSASSGGTNYVSTDFSAKNIVNQSGMQNGNGGISVVSVDIGYNDSYYLNDVAAPDLAAPNIININTVARTVDGTSSEKITWQNPGDNGTKYYHKAESYDVTTLAKISDSNITENVLTTGVGGYRYYVNTSSTVGTVTASNSTYTTNNYYVSEAGNVDKYLHVAAVDVAGNIGPEIVVPLAHLSNTWPICTRETTIEQILPNNYTNDMKYIYEEDDVHYIKGDTLFMMKYAAYMTHSAYNDYQINQVTLTATNNNKEQWFSTTVPNKSIALETYEYNDNEIQLTDKGDSLMLREYSKKVYKESYQEDIYIEQAFRILNDSDGKRITIVPSAIAKYKDTFEYTDSVADMANKIVVEGDSTAPKITSTNSSIENNKNLGTITSTKVFNFEIEDWNKDSSDYGSGVSEFYKIILENKTSGVITSISNNTTDEDLLDIIDLDYSDDKKALDLELTINIAQLGGFEGESTLTLEFRDNVGNINSKTYSFVGNTTSHLKIDANNGIFNDSTIDSSFVRDNDKEILYKSAKYQTMVNVPSIKAGPDGYVATFVSGNYGVSDVDKITSKTKFNNWKYDPDPLNGEIVDNKYIFLGEGGALDTLTAQYIIEPITLPNVKEHTEQYKFIGWYNISIDADDPVAYEDNFVGMPGDKITLSSNQTLWARYSTLVLTSTPNYIANDKKGAIDAKWTQNDDFLYRKKYVLWQQEFGSDWKTIDKDGNIME